MHKAPCVFLVVCMFVFVKVANTTSVFSIAIEIELYTLKLHNNNKNGGNPRADCSKPLTEMTGVGRLVCKYALYTLQLLARRTKKGARLKTARRTKKANT